MSTGIIKCEFCGKACDALITVARRVYRPTEQYEGIYVTTAAATFCDWPCVAGWTSKRGPDGNSNAMWGDL